MDVTKYPVWDKTQAYEKYTIVNYQGALFVALNEVPADTAIDDTSKWLMIYKNQAFTNHERFQMLMIEWAGEGGSGGDIPTLQQIFAKHKNVGLNIQVEDDIIPNLVLRYDASINSLSPYGIELAGDGEYFRVKTVGDPDTLIEISDTILAVLKRRLGMYSVIRAEHDNWVLNANSRGAITIPVLADTSNEEIIAYRVINLQPATQEGVNRDSCVLQFFQTANSRKSAQVAVKNVSSEAAKIKVIVECLVGTVV